MALASLIPQMCPSLGLSRHEAANVRAPMCDLTPRSVCLSRSLSLSLSLVSLSVLLVHFQALAADDATFLFLRE